MSILSEGRLTDTAGLSKNEPAMTLFHVAPSKTPGMWGVFYTPTGRNIFSGGPAVGAALFFGTESECREWAAKMENA